MVLGGGGGVSGVNGVVDVDLEFFLEGRGWAVFGGCGVGLWGSGSQM